MYNPKNNLIMGKTLFSSNCPNCGAQLTVDAKTNALICQYCSSIIAVSIKSKAEQIDEQEQDVTLKIIRPELKYMANYYIDTYNAQGGHLWITKDEVVFKPHRFNFGDLGKRYIRIQNIAGYTKGFFTDFSIWTRNGDEMPLVVWKKNEIIRELEKRRHTYYESRGLETPKLQYGNVHI